MGALYVGNPVERLSLVSSSDLAKPVQHVAAARSSLARFTNRYRWQARLNTKGLAPCHDTNIRFMRRKGAKPKRPHRRRPRPACCHALQHRLPATKNAGKFVSRLTQPGPVLKIIWPSFSNKATTYQGLALVPCRWAMDPFRFNPSRTRCRRGIRRIIIVLMVCHVSGPV